MELEKNRLGLAIADALGPDNNTVVIDHHDNGETWSDLLMYYSLIRKELIEFTESLITIRKKLPDSSLISPFTESEQMLLNTIYGLPSSLNMKLNELYQSHFSRTGPLLPGELSVAGHIMAGYMEVSQTLMLATTQYLSLITNHYQITN